MDNEKEDIFDFDPYGAASYIRELEDRIQELESQILRKDEEIDSLRSDVLFYHLKLDEVREFFRPLLVKIEHGAGDLKSKLDDISEEVQE